MESSKCVPMFQHIVLAIKMAISYFIPDVPRWVEVNLAKMEYETKQALLKEVSVCVHMQAWVCVLCGCMYACVCAQMSFVCVYFCLCWINVIAVISTIVV